MAGSDSLGVFFRDLLRRWKIATAVTIAVVIGAAAYASTLPDRYQGEAVLSFAPRANDEGSITVGADTLRVLLPRYVAYATAPATLRAVADDIGEPRKLMGNSIDAKVTSDSGNVAIVATMPTARRAAAAANAVADATLEFYDDDLVLEGVVVSPALTRSSPSGPPRRLIALASAFVGAVLGAGVALLLERGRPRVRTWRDAALVTGYQVVGRVPSAKALRGAPTDALSDPVVGAAIRTLRTNLERLSRDRPVHVVVVTSSSPGEGKTTIAATLAVTLGRLDARVLLIDADLRRPGLSKLFKADPTRGLLTVLRGDSTLTDAIQVNTTAGVHLLPTAADRDADDLLASHFADVIREARGLYDVIVVDAPPLLGADDSRTLAAMSDGVLMVVGSDTLASSVREAATALDELGVRVLGAVANRSRDPLGYGTYGAYGAYGANADVAGAPERAT